MFHRHASKWLSRAYFDRGLVIPAQPGHGAVDLRLSSEQVELVRGTLVAVLGWADFQSALTVPRETVDTWCISEWASARGSRIGTGVAVKGRYTDATSSLRRATRIWRNRLSRFNMYGVVVPLCAIGHTSSAVNADRDVSEILCTLLADRPDIRRHLDERGRVERLAQDLRSNRLTIPRYRTGVRRVTMEVLTAMRGLGYEHKFYGRPLPDDPVPELGEVITRVLDRVRANPYAQGVEIEEGQVRAVVERAYLRVEPWPVRALIE